MAKILKDNLAIWSHWRECVIQKASIEGGTNWSVNWKMTEKKELFHNIQKNNNYVINNFK